MTSDTQLLGTWRLAGLSRATPAGVAIPDRPRHGLLTFAPGGRMSLMLTWTGRAAPAADLPTDDERAELHKSLIAFAGRYSTNGGRVTFHVEMSWNETWTGEDHPRHFALEADRLTLVTDPRPSALDGKDSIYTQVWRRIAA